MPTLNRRLAATANIEARDADVQKTAYTFRVVNESFLVVPTKMNRNQSAEFKLAEDCFWKCLEYTVPAEWLDRNGHANMHYFLVLVDQALTNLPQKIWRELDPLPLHIEVRDSHLFYKKEIFENDNVVVLVQPLARQGASVELLVRTVKEDVVCSDCWIEGLLVDPEKGGSAEISEHLANAIDQKIETGRDQLWRAPKVKPAFDIIGEVERWFVSQEGIAHPESLDATGRLSIDAHFQLFSYGGMGMFAELNRIHNVFAKPDVSGFALSTRIRFHDKLHPGQRYKIRSRATSLRRKTVTYRHELLTEDAETKAFCDHTMVFIDMSKRRSMPVPDEFKAVLSEYYGVVIP